MEGTAPFELFHRLADAASSRVRGRITALGVKDRIEFRNVHYESHAQALAAHGGGDVPALWEGQRLIVGEAEIDAWLDKLIAK